MLHYRTETPLAEADDHLFDFPDDYAEGPIPDRPRTFPWYALVHLELQLGVDVGASAILRRLEAKWGTAPDLAMTVRSAELRFCLERRDVDRFLVILPEYGGLCEANSQQRDQPEARTKLQPVKFGDLASLSLVGLGFARSAVAGMMGALVLADNEPGAIELSRLIGTVGDGLRAAIESPLGRPIVGADVEMTGLLTIRWLLDDGTLSPEQLYGATMSIFVWLTQLAMAAPITAIWSLLVDQWRQLVRERRMTLTAPALAVSRIEAALTIPPSIEAVASLLHEAELGVSMRLPPDYRTIVDRILG